MSGVEYFRNTIIETCNPDLLEKYRSTQNVIQTAIKAVLNPPEPFGERDETSGLGQALRNIMESPAHVADKLDPEDPTTIAAMLIGAVSQRAYIYEDFAQAKASMNFEKIWERTSLQGLAARCDEVVGEIVPETNGRFVNIDLQKMSDNFRKDVNNGTQEHIVLTGLNATGKSFLIGLFDDYLKECGIPAKIVKMPRPDGPLSQVIGQALKGDLKLRPDAMQLAFLSDALDVEPEPETLMVFDRHPRTEAYVYGPPSIAPTVLSTHELFSGVYWTFIIDRHPMACAMRVAERDTQGERSPRIFERKVETMTEQLIRFARLSVLPGTHWINNDLPITSSEETKWNFAKSSTRLIGSVFYSGILQRLLIKQGKFDNYNLASTFILKKFLACEDRWEKARTSNNNIREIIPSPKS